MTVVHNPPPHGLDGKIKRNRSAFTCLLSVSSAFQGERENTGEAERRGEGEEENRRGAGGGEMCDERVRGGMTQRGDGERKKSVN